MSKNKTIMRITNIIFGFLAVTLFIFNFFVLIRLQPKMINFEGISEFENGLLTAVGFNLLVILVFYLLSLWHFVRYLRNAEAIKPLPLFLVISGVLSLLCGILFDISGMPKQLNPFHFSWSSAVCSHYCLFSAILPC